MPGQQGFFSRSELTNTQPYAQCGTAPFVKLALMLRCCGFVPCSDWNELLGTAAPLSGRPGNRRALVGPAPARPISDRDTPVPVVLSPLSASVQAGNRLCTYLIQ